MGMRPRRTMFLPNETDNRARFQRLVDILVKKLTARIPEYSWKFSNDWASALSNRGQINNANLKNCCHQIGRNALCCRLSRSGYHLMFSGPIPYPLGRPPYR
jgi:hypothetical protein